MKKLLFVLGLAAMMFTGCDKEETTITVNPSNPEVKGTLSPSGRPSWNPESEHGYGSMCIFVDECGVPATLDSKDILAGFINGKCYGAVEPIYDDSEKYWRFNLAVNGPSDQTSALSVELRYYSAKNGGTYTAKTILYNEGTPTGGYGKGNGFVPTWK